MKAKEYYENTFFMDWMNEGEKELIYKATELFAIGILRQFIGQTITEESVQLLKTKTTNQ